MLTLQQVSTGYGKHVIGNNLNAQLAPASLTILLGINGAGKSTLLRTIAGFQPALSGNILCEEEHLQSLRPRQLARVISVVLTSRPTAEALTARQVVETGRMPYSTLLSRPTPEDSQAINRAVELTQTQALLPRFVNTLSDGERQRIFIAKALAQDTPIILLDEPTAFLDFPTKVHTFKLLSRLAHEEGKSILISTHDVEMALHFADTLWLLSRQGITTGSPHQLAADGTIDRFFSQEGLRFDANNMRFEY